MKEKVKPIIHVAVDNSKFNTQENKLVITTLRALSKVYGDHYNIIATTKGEAVQIWSDDRIVVRLDLSDPEIMKSLNEFLNEELWRKEKKDE